MTFIFEMLSYHALNSVRECVSPLLSDSGLTQKMKAI
jgi:hypothetical protein